MPKIAANGLHIEYESIGRDRDPAIVLVAGIGEQIGGLHFPLEFCQMLARHDLRVIRFDNRDAGLTTHMGEDEHTDYSLVDMAKDVAALAEVLDLHAVHLVGACIGGSIARHLAIRHPGLVKSLTLIMSRSGAKPGSVRADRFSSTSPAVMEWMMTRTRPARSLNAAVDAYVEMFRAFCGNKDAFDESWVRPRAEAACLRAYDPGGVGRQMAAAARSPELLEIQSDISCPTTVIHGDADPVFGIDHGYEIAQRIPRAHFERIEGMGHEMPPWVWPSLIESILSLTIAADPPLAIAG